MLLCQSIINYRLSVFTLLGMFYICYQQSSEGLQLSHLFIGQYEVHYIDMNTRYEYTLFSLLLYLCLLDKYLQFVTMNTSRYKVINLYIYPCIHIDIIYVCE